MTDPENVDDQDHDEDEEEAEPEPVSTESTGGGGVVGITTPITVAPSYVQTVEQQLQAEKAARELGFLSVEELRAFLLTPTKLEKIPEIPEDILLPKPEVPEFLKKPAVPVPSPVSLPPREEKEEITPPTPEEERVPSLSELIVLSTRNLVTDVVKPFINSNNRS